jgi:mono/diheme cytochrome c family protein
MPTAVLAIAAALSCFGPPAEAQTAAAVGRGRELAERSCAGCHAIDGGAGSIVQGTAVPSFTAIAGRPNQTAERLKAFILTPHRPMPGMHLTVAEVDDIVAFVLSLR